MEGTPSPPGPSPGRGILMTASPLIPPQVHLLVPRLCARHHRQACADFPGVLAEVQIKTALALLVRIVLEDAGLRWTGVALGVAEAIQHQAELTSRGPLCCRVGDLRFVAAVHLARLDTPWPSLS